MTDPFVNFRENIKLPGCDEPIGEAYRMDGDAPEGMRARAGLGGLACCDYLRVKGEKFILIEDTDLDETASDLEKEYDSLKSDKKLQRKFVRERIRRENCLKVYGALLVLCRMQQWPAHCEFWLVTTSREQTKFASHQRLQEEIRLALNGEPGQQSPVEGALMGDKLVQKVKVMTADRLREALGKA